MICSKWAKLSLQTVRDVLRYIHSPPVPRGRPRSPDVERHLLRPRVLRRHGLRVVNMAGEGSVIVRSSS